MAKERALVIVGPTASGKSDLAVRLALRLRSGLTKKFNVEIISADSRQVYKGLNIGTGKITKREMRGIPHHLLDVADPKKQFSASDFTMLTNKAIAEIVKIGKIPIVVGGTGFYIDTLAGKVVLPDVPPDKLLRRKLNKLSKEELFKILKKKDLRRARMIDPNNKVRLIRALEIVEALGKVPPLGNLVSKWGFIYIGLKPEDLEKRIEKRLRKRIDGIIQEATKLLKLKKLSYKRMHELGLEYRYAAMYIQDKLSKLDMFNKLNMEIKKYAKRQMTWFKRNKKIKWFRPEQFREIEKYARIALEKGD
jgi:tRNA dimethylallyltransferase